MKIFEFQKDRFATPICLNRRCLHFVFTIEFDFNLLPALWWEKAASISFFFLLLLFSKHCLNAMYYCILCKRRKGEWRTLCFCCCCVNLEDPLLSKDRERQLFSFFPTHKKRENVFVMDFSGNSKFRIREIAIPRKRFFLGGHPPLS